MSYFLIPDNAKPGEDTTISGDEARHISLSRRAKVGDEIFVQAPNEKRFSATIKKFSKSNVNLTINNEVVVPPEPKTRIVLLQALIAEQALDTILQKATELGACDLVLFPAQRSPVGFAIANKKQGRWGKIIQEAAKQSDRLKPPKLILTKSIGEALDYSRGCEFLIIMDPRRASPQTWEKKKLNTIGLVVGPEGGFTDSELEAVMRAKAQPMRFGPRILRAETAAIAGIAILQERFGDLK